MVCLVAATCLFAGGWRQSDAPKVTTLNVGYDLGTPGANVTLAIELVAPEGVEVGTTLNELSFSAKRLTFVEVRPGGGEVEATGTLKSDPGNPEDSILQVRVTARQGASLPNGVVASVVFKVSDEAKEQGTLKLKNSPSALSNSNPPVPIAPLEGRDGEVELLGAPPAAYACDFYMH